MFVCLAGGLALGLFLECFNAMWMESATARMGALLFLSLTVLFLRSNRTDNNEYIFTEGSSDGVIQFDNAGITLNENEFNKTGKDISTHNNEFNIGN